MAVVWARHLYEFLVARFVNGLFTGLVSLVVPAHIAEMAVVSDRGTDGALHQLAITLGMLYAYVIGRFLDWAWLAVCCALPSALLLLPAVWLLVESPRWLLQRGEGQRARQALIGVRTAKSQAEVEFDATQAIFPRYRTPLPHYFLALLVMVTQQMSGVNSIIISTTSIEPGPEFSLESMDNIVMLALLQGVFVAGFSAGLGPVPWILAAELTPLRGTGLEFGTVCAANWAGSFVTANVFAITATTKMLAVSLWVYSGITITGGLVIFALLPETTSMSIEEILLLGNDEQAAKKKNKKTKEVLDAADRAPLSSKKEDAAPASLPPAPAEQERPAEAELVSKASEKQIAAAEKLQPRRPGSRSPSVASRRSTASKASRASRQQAERASKKDSQ
ncbi:trehalose transporter 1-like protein [Amblyomma americanum]